MRSRPLVSLTLAAVVLAGCSSPEPPRPGVLSVGLGEPGTLLPADATDPSSRLVTAALWTPLADYDPATGKVTPRAAASIDSPDRVVWTVKLRPGAKFHDGTAVTAQSYADTWQAIAGNHWASTPLLTKSLRAKEITAVDANQLRIVLDRPSNQVPAWLSAPGLVPLPASVLKSKDWNGFARRPVGNGPFRLDGDWRPGSGGTLVRVAPDSGRANEIDLRVGDPAKQYDEVKDGTLDVATSVPGERHEAMHADFADRHAMWALPQAGYLVFPATATRFATPAVRHAFALGTDRDALESGPLAHQADPAKSLLPPAAAPGERSGPCRPCTFDAPAAKSLLGQAGFAGEATVSYDSFDGTWPQALAAGLSKSLGISVTAQRKESGGQPIGPSTLELKALSASPADVLRSLAEAAGYTDPGFTDDLDSAESTASPEEAAQLFRVAENEALRDLPAVPVWIGHGHAVWSARVHDAVATPFSGIDLAKLRD
ncbi:peptide ABC transporter substrate-binding protein [Amycolatopsis benzoatilytica]|uniref:peptide ABC transporter substrate-binding protein n=1 Tax=Amycolatopsis benzoatilytica TaxID=346045 RepID=UPI0003752F56|nr:ABC transporter substrate-binding protein [Amycolatopsis benzoatilytica]